MKSFNVCIEKRDSPQRGIDHVAQEHGDGHGTDAARDRGDPAGAFCGGLELHIAR